MEDYYVIVLYGMQCRVIRFLKKGEKGKFIPVTGRGGP
jgi:hypothetical protein